MTRSLEPRMRHTTGATLDGLLIGSMIAVGLVFMWSVAGPPAMEGFFGVSLFRLQFAIVVLGGASGLAAGLLEELLFSLLGVCLIGVLAGASGTLVFEVAMSGCSRGNAQAVCEVFAPIAGALIGLQVATAER